jgi:hypothetical protein
VSALSNYSYQWRRGGDVIAGATTATYTIGEADLGAELSCTVTATNAGGSSVATSTATSAVLRSAGLLSSMPWNSGATVDDGAFSTFAGYRGIPLDITGCTQPYDTWSDLTSNDYTFALMAGFDGPLAIAFAGLPSSLSGTAVDTNLQGVLAGTFDDYYTSWVNMLRAYGRQTSVVRLMWEFNANSAQPWLTTQTASSSLWKDAWNHVAALFKQACPSLQVCYNLAAGNTGIGGIMAPSVAADYFPGPTYCDIVGTDSYDFYLPATNPTSWAAQLAKVGGINDTMELAKTYNLKWAVPEWGCINSPGHDSNAGGDNPYYVQQMIELFQTQESSLAFESYYDTAADTSTSSDICNSPPVNPNAALEYKAVYQSLRS